ncbi:MAG: biosynthetic-type acetolactate synthase large subunit [Eubacteriales bacterium]|nr:biosynthetic-type acetolactate synthase large subunit [Eubacteriales bacterium]MDD3199783.1 biosynthetic-type acetolactate synthase large subunit [Eubacteriales bacterium]MDD4122479.1 biosynthetic-type acetolactate synthase large subunit [Eubacteriales bacterium]MDD4630049.1 biosynthetic-type acetolactate synthase large subunit [Eubacteriales bacterium]
MQLKGSKIIIECLLEQNVDTIFGYPGGQIMPLYDALYDYQDRVKHILTSHEQGAAHAADGYARSTGKTGVCFATSGPGATNTVTGIATAYIDSIPLVVITGQVPISSIGKDSFQEVDIVGITLPITKHSFFCRTVEDLAPNIRKAFQIAKSGRPGPVLVDVPKNLMVELGEYEPCNPEYIECCCPSNDPDMISLIAQEINASEKPVIYAGGGVIIAEASQDLTEFAMKANIPVITTLMSMGSFDRKNPLSLGMVGMHGQKEANMAVHHSDLIIAIGARFSDRVTGDTSRFAKGAKIIHIDIDSSEFGKNMRFNYCLKCDVKSALQALIPEIEKKDRTEWNKRIDSWKKKKKGSGNKLNSDNIYETLNEVLGDDVIIATDVGQHQMWTAQKWPFRKPRTFITSGGLGTMGFGLGAAIGAQIGNPGKRIIHISGDGSFRMNMNELATVAAYDLPIISIIVKNHTLGMVRQWQKLFFDKRYSSTDLPDVIEYNKLASAFGLYGRLVKNRMELRKALEEALNTGRGAVIACDISIDEDVTPIVPPGEAINNQLLTETMV